MRGAGSGVLALALGLAHSVPPKPKQPVGTGGPERRAIMCVGIGQAYCRGRGA
jgi:hypothetical protein